MKSYNDNFLRACRKEPVDHIPVWYMRQAGRYQPEYRKIREKYSLMEIVKRPEVCTEVTLLPIHQLNVDAAILFSDIMTPIESMGVPNEIKPNFGPYIPNPVRSASDIDKLIVPDFAETIPYVGETIKMLRGKLNVPLIGFCGAPFTLASYIIEGGPSKNYVNTKTLMYSDPESWHKLIGKLALGMVKYLTYQVESGAQALQVFDSWIGALSQEDYLEYVFPHMQMLFHELRQNTDVPVIHFGVNTGHLIEHLKEAGGDVIGFDWKTNITEGWKRLNHEVAIQGNLDPGALIAPWEVIEQKTKFILDQVDRDGFIFNLGHGITPNLKVETMQRLTEYIHSYRVDYNSPPRGEVRGGDPLHNKSYLKEKRQDLRNNATPAEATLWNALKNKQLEGRKFRRQHSIGNYIVDFFCVSESLVIELDGETHNNSFADENDMKRTQFLNDQGVKVIRFENKEVFENMDLVLHNIKEKFD